MPAKLEAGSIKDRVFFTPVLAMSTGLSAIERGSRSIHPTRSAAGYTPRPFFSRSDSALTSLVSSIARVGALGFLSRLLGFVRDLVVARVFGADASTDAFFVAFKIPNLMRRLFAEGAFSLALVPVLNDYKTRQGPAALKRFLDDMAGTLGAALLVVTAVGVLAAPVLILVFAPGFAVGQESAPGQRELAVELVRLTFPYVLFVTLTALAGAILNTFERFGVPAFTPVLLNLTLIGCALFLAPLLERPILGLAIGVLLAGAVSSPFGAVPVAAEATPASAASSRKIQGYVNARAHGAGAAGLVGRSDQSSARYHPRLVPGHGQHLLALLLGPPDGAPDGGTGSRTGNRDAAAAHAAPCGRGPSRFFENARLGLTLAIADRPAGRGRAGRSRRTHRCNRILFRTWTGRRLLGARRPHDRTEYRRLRSWTGRLYRREDPGARLLRPPARPEPVRIALVAWPQI